MALLPVIFPFRKNRIRNDFAVENEYLARRSQLRLIEHCLASAAGGRCHMTRRSTDPDLFIAIAFSSVGVLLALSVALLVHQR